MDNHAAPGRRRWSWDLLLQALQLGADPAHVVQDESRVGALLVKVRAGQEAGGGVLQGVTVDLERKEVEFFRFILAASQLPQ